MRKAVRTTARTAAFMPWASPPEVSMPMRTAVLSGAVLVLFFNWLLGVVASAGMGSFPPECCTCCTSIVSCHHEPRHAHGGSASTAEAIYESTVSGAAPAPIRDGR